MSNSASLSVKVSVHYSAIMSNFQFSLFIGSSLLVVAITFILVSIKDEIDDPNLGLILVLSLGIIVNVTFTGFLFA